MKKDYSFALKFLVIFAVLYLIVFLADTKGIENNLAELEGQLTGVNVQGNQLNVNGNNLEINYSCTGLFSTILIIALVFSLRKPEIDKKLYIIVVSVIVLMLFNVLRVFMVIETAKNDFSLASNVHVIGWFISTLLVLGLWYYLTKKFTGKKLNKLI
ncbi:MAG: exosortase/archaeosortase family protein [archaeon]